MKLSFLPVTLLCGSWAVCLGHAAPLTPASAPGLSSTAESTAGQPRPLTARVPATSVRLLGGWRSGTAIGAADLGLLASALLHEGTEPLGCALPAGTTTLILQLDHAHALRRCQFVNLNTQDGRVTLATAAVQLPPESPRWHSAAGGPQSLGDAREGTMIQEMDLSADARYVRVEINLPQPGRLASLALFERAEQALPAADQMPARRLVAAFSLASSSSAAAFSHPGSVVAVSAGESAREAGAMIDGDLATGYTFRRTGGRGALTVFDLARRAAPERLTVSYRSGSAGRVDAYLLDELPSSHSESAIRQLLASRTPDGSAPLTAAPSNQGPRTGLQRAGITLGNRSGRFLALVFSAGNGGGPARDGKDDFKDRVDGKDGGTAPGTRGPSANQPSTSDRGLRSPGEGEFNPGSTDRGSRSQDDGDYHTATMDRALEILEITATGTDRFGPLLTSNGNSTGPFNSPGGTTGGNFAPGSFFSPAGNFTSVSPGVDSAGPLLPPGFTTPQVTP